MRDELSAPSLSTLRTRRDVPSEIVVDLAERLVDSDVGPIVAYKRDESGEPGTDLLERYATVIQKTAVFSDTGYWEPDTTGGSGRTEVQAQAAALGEAIERYCHSLCDLNEFRTAPYADLNTPAVHPMKVNKFSDEQLNERGLSSATISHSEYHWTATRALVSGEPVLVPGQLVYLPFDPPLTIRSPMTTGAAAGIDYETTLYRAICEVVERECFIIGYLNELPYPHVDLSSTDDEDVRMIHRALEALGKEVYVLDISLDHPFSTCLAIAVDRNDKPALSLGMECDADMLAAVRGALKEAYQISAWDPTVERPAATPQEIQTIPQRAHYWAGHDRISDLDFWLSASQRVPIEINEKQKDVSGALDRFIDYLDQTGHECYVADLTTPDIASQSFCVLKAIIPDFHPMHLIERFKYLGGDRLYRAPVQAGYLDAPKKPADLNEIPHPFL